MMRLPIKTVNDDDTRIGVCDDGNDDEDLCSALIKNIFRLLLPRIKSIYQVRSALHQHLPLLAIPALSLENWTALTNVSTTAAAIVPKASQYLVSLTTQPLVLDSGRCHHLLALQTAVAARVSGGEKIVESFLFERYC